LALAILQFQYHTHHLLLNPSIKATSKEEKNQKFMIMEEEILLIDKSAMVMRRSRKFFYEIEQIIISCL
jgi:hypothetical protein